jgi:monofunctional biosynthetic peptidoglycan transglycosylase
MVLYDFSTPEAVAAWVPVNDVVMGGVSRGLLEANGNGSAVFHGEVSLEHNGGFASIRSKPEPRDLSACTGIELRVCGDRRRFKLNLKADRLLDGILHRARFETEPGSWQTIRLPFTDFQPTFRGRVLEAAEPLDLSRITSLGLMISDRQAGRFRLEVRSIAAYRE